MNNLLNDSQTQMTTTSQIDSYIEPIRFEEELLKRMKEDEKNVMSQFGITRSFLGKDHGEQKQL